MRVSRNFHIAVMVATVLFFVCFQTAVAEPPEQHQHRYRAGNLELPKCMDRVEDLQAQIEELQSI